MSQVCRNGIRKALAGMIIVRDGKGKSKYVDSKRRFGCTAQ